MPTTRTEILTTYYSPLRWLALRTVELYGYTLTALGR